MLTVILYKGSESTQLLCSQMIRLRVSDVRMTPSTQTLVMHRIASFDYSVGFTWGIQYNTVDKKTL